MSVASRWRLGTTIPKLAVTRSSRPGSAHGGFQQVEQARSRLGGVCGVADAMHDEHELVATETSHDIALPRTVGEPLRHLPQHLVASQVTEGVVHHLEAVQIEKKHR